MNKNMFLMNFKRLSKDLIIPKKAYKSDAGFDLYCNKRVLIKKGERVCIPLGFAMKLPRETCGLIQGKSGLAINHGITTIGNIIDENYRGECHAILLNHGERNVEFFKGDKIAQLLIIKLDEVYEFHEVEKLDKTERDQGGFGSTGK